MAKPTPLNLQRQPLSAAISKAIKEDFVIDKTEDENVLETSNFSWDDLNALKNDLGHQILQFVSQVNAIVTNKDIVENLGDKRENFTKTVNMFFSDVNEFSSKVKVLRESHEHLTGKVKNVTDFDVYNRIAYTYHAHYSELTALVTPTLSELVLVIAEVQQAIKASIHTPESSTPSVQPQTEEATHV